MAERRKSADPVKQVARIKVISMGDEGVGKSCLIKRYCEGKFVSKHITTIGIDYGVKPVQVDGEKVHINFWDLAGGEEYYEIRNEFYRDSQGAVLCFDVGSKASFGSLAGWLKEAARHGAPANMVIVVCGNKVDNPKRAVSEAEAKAWAAANGAAFYIETSTKDGQNVQEMFERLFGLIAAATKAA